MNNYQVPPGRRRLGQSRDIWLLIFILPFASCLRDSKNEPHYSSSRRNNVAERKLLLKGGGGGSHGSVSFTGGHSGCLTMSNSQLDALWHGRGNRPDCSYHSGGGGGSGGGSSGGGSSGGGSSGGGSSGGSNGGSNGGNGGGGNGGGGNGNGGNNNGNSNGGNGNGGNGNGGNGNGGNGNGGNGNGGNNNGNGNGGNGNGGNGNGNNNGENDADGNDGRNGGDVDNNDANGNNQQNNGDSYDPYDDFDIEDCSTYENLWRWDVILTCSEESPSDCTCGYAKALMEYEYLDCSDMESCPKECQICESCMRLLGCNRPVSSGSTGPNSMSETRWYILAAAAALVFSGILYVFARRKRDHEDAELTHQLLEEPEDADAAAAFAGGGSSSYGDGSAVWLAPETEVEQFGPSMRAALASYGAEIHDNNHGDNGSAASSISQSENYDGDVWLAPVTNIT